LFIEVKDFMEEPPKKYFRLGPGRVVRLKNAYIIECTDYKKDPESGRVTEIVCKYFPDSKSGEDTSGIKARGTLHWVSNKYAIDGEVRLYDRLFIDPNPLGYKEIKMQDLLNPNSLEIITQAKLESSLKEARAGDKFQFLRIGYFCVDKDSTANKPVFNRTVTLKDTWAKIQQKS
jgi:glutaminyl-tRNA synthetase